MTVKHETADNFRISERNDEFDLARLSISQGWDPEGVAKAIEIRGGPVYFGNKESSLMDVKIVVLRVLCNVTVKMSPARKRQTGGMYCPL
jgi:hypothetical protein